MEVDIIFGLALAAVVLTFIIQVARILRTAALHRTLRKAIEKDQPMTAELVEKLDRPPPAGEADQRAGFVLVALAVATLLAAWIYGASTENFRAMASIAMFPLIVGAALLIRLRLNGAQPEA